VWDSTKDFRRDSLGFISNNEKKEGKGKDGKANGKLE